MIAFRRAHPALSRESFYTGDEIQWFAAHGEAPRWGDAQENSIGCLIRQDGGGPLLLMFNAGGSGAEFVLPAAGAGLRWHLAADTAHAAPRDLFAAGEEPPCDGSGVCRLLPRSSVILTARSAS
jgi:glycogen operon protein